MSIRRQLLRPVAYLAGLHAQRQVSSFMRLHERTAESQHELLMAMLARAAQTAFGRDHGFAAIRSHEDFVKAVPLGDYQTHYSYIQRVLAGEHTALLPQSEPPIMFSMTSGTTGQPKFIPVTRRFAADMKRGWNVYGLRTLRDHPQAWLRPILQISSPMRESDSPTGLPCGAVSGLLARQQKSIVKRMYVARTCVSEIPDPTARSYALLRSAIGRDVSFIVTANPSSTIKLIQTGQERADRLIRDVADGTLTAPGDLGAAVNELRFKPNRALAARLEAGLRRDGTLLPRHFWNMTFLCNWTGGTLGLYLPGLREMFDGVPVRDIGLLASEGRFSIPIADGASAGLAEIMSNYLEFIPAAERLSANPATLRAHEVEPGQEYFLVFSNATGLWRYNLDDRVRVVDRIGQSPVFEFLCRGLRTANITGEKLAENQVVQAMQRSSSQLGMSVQRFVMQGRFAATPYYELRLELPHPATAPSLAEAFDRALCDLNIEYASKRKSARLGTVRATVLPPGTLEQAEGDNILRRGGRSEQYKHQYLLTEVLRDGE